MSTRKRRSTTTVASDNARASKRVKEDRDEETVGQQQDVADNDTEEKEEETTETEHPSSGNICKSRAKDEYLLNEEDLAPLSVTYKPNPHYRSGSSMSVYKLEDVQDAAVEKYGSLEALAEAKQAHEEEQAQRTEKRMQRKLELQTERRKKLKHALAKRNVPYPTESELCTLCNAFIQGARKPSMKDIVQQLHESNERKQQLVRALAARGLQLRSDSRLCDDYILGHGARTMSRVVDTMAEMHFYYSQTDYETRLDRAHENFERRVEYEQNQSRIEGRHREWIDRPDPESVKHSALRQFVQKRRENMSRDELLRLIPASLHPRVEVMLTDS